MEFELFLTILLIPILFSVTLLKMAKEKKKNKHSEPRLPPGPWKLPLIGNIHQLAFAGLPCQALRDLSEKHGPIMHLKLGQVSTVVVSSPEAAEQILKSHDLNFATRSKLIAADTLFYGRGDVAFAEYGEQWRQLRKVCVIELLSTKRVESFYRIREEEFEDLVRRVSGSTAAVINLKKGITSSTFNVVSRATLGKVMTEENEMLMSGVKEALRLSEGFSVSDLYPSVGFIRYLTGITVKLEKLKLKVDRVLENIIEEHRLRRRRCSNNKEEEEEDFVDVLLKHQYPSNTSDDDQFSLTTDNIKAVILDVLTGGIDTTSITIEWAMCELLKNPNALKKAQVEVRNVFSNKNHNNNGHVVEEGLHRLKYLKAIIKETLRLHPPGPLLIPRECRKTCEIHGFEIPIKTRVVINAWAISRDSKYWEDPECFKPERFLDSSIDYRGTCYAYIPFGAGRRICPGISFALANVELLLAKLLYHFDWRLPDGMKSEELDMTTAPGVSARRKSDLYVVPVPYQP